MKRFFLLILVAVAAMQCGLSAQLLWRIEGNGLKKTSYIFGTHHIAPPALLDSVAGLDKALKSVDRAYGELDMLGGAMEEAQLAMAVSAAAPADSTLSKLLTPEELGRLDAYVKNLTDGALSVAAFERAKPALLATTLGAMLNMKAFPGYNPEVQLDRMALTRAADAGIKTFGLETAAQQINLLLGQPISVQIRELMESVDDMERDIERAKALAAAYSAQDLGRLSQIMYDPDGGMTEEQAERLIYSRNDSWIATLMGILPTASVILVVGAGHLPGARGLIEQLRGRGFKVSPVQ